MKTPKLDDIIGDLYDKLDNVEVDDTDFGDIANTNVEVPTITDLSGTVTYYTSPLTKTPYAKITWTWTAPIMHDEDGSIIDPTDPLILDDINFDPVVDYMFGSAISGGTPTAYASTKGALSTITENHALGADITGSVYAVLKSGIIGPAMNYTTTVVKDTTAPGQPSAPVLVSTASIVTATFDGLLQGGGAQPSDYLYTEILAGTTNPPTTKVGEANGRGLYSFYATAGSTIYVQYYSYDTSLNKSVGSTVVSTVVKSILDDTGLTTALANKNAIYAQNADPVGNVGVTLHDGDWWYVTDATVPSKINTMKVRVAGAWVVDTVNASTVLAALSIVAGNINTGAIVADKIQSGEIYSKLMTTGELKADAIKTGLMTAAITISGMFQTAALPGFAEGTGSRVVINNAGISLFRYNSVTTNDDEVIKIPVSGDASFFGTLTATGLKVKGVMSLESSDNTIETGASLVLSTGITAPATAPSATNYWDYFNITDSSGANIDTSSVCRLSDGTFLCVASNSGAGAVLSKHTSAGVYSSSVSVTFGYDFYSTDFVAIGGYVYWTEQIGDDGSGNTYFAFCSADISTGVAAGSSFTASVPFKYTTGIYPKIFTDGTNICLLFSGASSSVIRSYSVTRANSTTVTVAWVKNTTIAAQVRSATRGTLDTTLDSFAYVTTVSGQQVVKHIKYSDSSVLSTYTFNIAVGETASALGYYSGTYWSVDSNGKVSNYDGFNWSGAATANYDFKYTYYDSNTGGTISPPTSDGTHESAASPKVTVPLNKRGKITISVAGWTTDTSTTDSVNQLRYYAIAAGGTLALQGASNTGSLNLSTIGASAAPPATSNFPSSTPGKITNPTGTLVISGDGTLRFINPYRMYAEKTVSFAVGTSYTRMTTLTEILDQANAFTPATGFYVAPADDYYDMVFNVAFATSSTRRFATIEVGTAAAGSNLQIAREEGPVTGYASMSVVVMNKWLTAGSSVAAVVFSASATDIRGDFSACSFSVKASS